MHCLGVRLRFWSCRRFTSMRTKTPLLALAAACLGAVFVGGFWAGRRTAASSGRQAAKTGSAKPSLSAEFAKSLPAIPPIGAANQRLDLKRKPTVAEVTARIQEMAGVGVARSNKE